MPVYNRLEGACEPQLRSSSSLHAGASSFYEACSSTSLCPLT